MGSEAGISGVGRIDHIKLEVVLVPAYIDRQPIKPGRRARVKSEKCLAIRQHDGISSHDLAAVEATYGEPPSHLVAGELKCDGYRLIRVDTELLDYALVATQVSFCSSSIGSNQLKRTGAVRSRRRQSQCTMISKK